jgi:uncharacterized protein
MMRHHTLVLFLGTLMVVIGPSLAKVASASEIDMTWGVKITMRDGIRLNATVFRPRDQVQPLPVIVTLTPYISDSYYPRASYFAQNGYVFAVVDVRGRGNSEGSFAPMENEARDGYDVVEWFATQPWSNGKIGMWGGSYGGFDQWLTARERPPHLATIVPASAAAAGQDFPSVNGVRFPYQEDWSAYTSGVTSQQKLFEDSTFWAAKYRRIYESHLAFRDLDRLVGVPSPWFQKTLQHPGLDAYWASMRLSAADFARIDVPILTITGYYDANLPQHTAFGGDQLGALTYYRMHMAEAGERARSRHFLIVGPWDHGGTRTPALEVGGLVFGPASLLDMNGLHKAWYDWTLKDGPRPEFLKKQVAYYTVPGDEWKYADGLDSIAAGTLAFFLDSDGRANDVFRSGQLTVEKPGTSSPDQYVYDPLDTRSGGLETPDFENVLTDQRLVMNTFGNGVIYHSPPFAEGTEITGVIRLAVWMTLDVPDTDFLATIYEVLPDGSSVLLAEDVLRARYRDSLERPTLVTIGEAVRYEFKTMPFFSRQIAKGSRLRLFLRCPNSIFFEKNYNSGGDVAAETGKDARVAHVTVHHDAQHPSVLELPVVK